MSWGWTSRLSLFLFVIVYGILFAISEKELRVEERKIAPWALYLVLWIVGPVAAFALYALSNLAGLVEIESKPRWAFARYKWDVVSWWVFSTMGWILVIVQAIVFFGRHGLAASPNFAAPFTDQAANEYESLLYVSAVISYISIFAGIESFWAEGFNCYDLMIMPKSWVNKRVVVLKP